MTGLVQEQRSFVAPASVMTGALVLVPVIVQGGAISDAMIATPAETYDRDCATGYCSVGS